jgi:tetratricopeptide (TPR) repeat protein
MPESAQFTMSVAPDDVVPDADREVLSPDDIVAGRYLIRAVLGRGGNAVVYRAHDQHLGVDVALKVLRPERASAAALNRFRREVQLPRIVSSPHLVKVFDIGSDGPLSYLTMELVDGESLRERLHRGPLSAGETVRIAEGILRGLAALHAGNIIHRDIKPENVLLSVDAVKVADFGLSRLIDDEMRHTATGSLVGTWRYLAPEQVAGEAAGPRGDLYAAGLVMFEMLTGRTPFQADSNVGVLLTRLQAPSPNVRRYRPDAPQWLANVIARLLERSPGERYGSAEEVLAALDERRAVAAPSARRRIAGIAGGLLLLVLLVAALATFERVRASHRYSHLVAPPEGGIAAIRADGQVLWARPDVDPSAASRWVLVRRTPGGDPELALVLNGKEDYALEHVRRLSFVDPQTGHVNRTVVLPASPKSFPRSPARFNPGSIYATDLNGDGVDEVVTWFGHVPEWASFVDIYDPKTDRSRIVFEGYGQHGIGGLFDLDGDGRKELILLGYNNGLGWYNAMAALRLDIPWERGPDRSPDFAAGGPTLEGLLWYALLPRGHTSGETDELTFDRNTRQFTVDYSGPKTLVIGADGFLPSDASRLPVRERQAARFEAYAHLREARRLSHARIHDPAIREMDAAVALARRASDTILVEAMRKERGEIFVAAGRAAEAEEIFSALVPRAQYGAETAYDAARAFHLAGDLARALKWYRTGFALRATAEEGKSIHEFLQGIVFVHAERHDWKAAEEDLQRFRSTFIDSPSDSIGMYREFLRWRMGQVPTLDQFDIAPNATDLLRYWTCEFRFARGDDPRTVLRQLDADIAAGSSEAQSAMWSLRAELLTRLGRRAEARDAMVRATASLADDEGVSIIARAHGEVVRERAARLAGVR